MNRPSITLNEVGKGADAQDNSIRGVLLFIQILIPCKVFEKKVQSFLFVG